MSDDLAPDRPATPAPDHDPRIPAQRPAPTGTIFVAILLTFFTSIVIWLLAYIYLSDKPVHLIREGESGLPVMGRVEAFELTERRGGTVTPQDLRGKMWVADFIFTSCAGPCPSMTRNLRKASETIGKWPDLSPHVRYVSISVDPARDTPDVLSKYARTYDAESDNWLFLTGDYGEIQRLATDAFHLAVVDPNAETGEPVIHSTRFVLVDGEGAIRGYYDGQDLTRIEAMIRDMRLLLPEVRTSNTEKSR